MLCGPGSYPGFKSYAGEMGHRAGGVEALGAFGRRTRKYRDCAAEIIDANLDGDSQALRERRDETMLEPDFDPFPTAVPA